MGKEKRRARRAARLEAGNTMDLTTEGDEGREFDGDDSDGVDVDEEIAGLSFGDDGFVDLA